jgi:hypothetical protein
MASLVGRSQPITLNRFCTEVPKSGELEPGDDDDGNDVNDSVGMNKGDANEWHLLKDKILVITVCCIILRNGDIHYIFSRVSGNAVLLDRAAQPRQQTMSV